jgi:hypothetical protein
MFELEPVLTVRDTFAMRIRLVSGRGRHRQPAQELTSAQRLTGPVHHCPPLWEA